MNHHFSFARTRVLCALFASVLVACGGGGGDGSNTSPSPTPPNSPAPAPAPAPAPGQPPAPAPVANASGFFVDSPVQGLDYYIDGVKAGVTGADGKFDYVVGKAVTFKLGNVTLGTASGAGLALVTPADLTSSPSSLINMLVLLQSLDADQNPANGIFIPSDKKALLTTPVDLSQPGSSLAAVQANLPGQTWVTTVAAQNHFVGGSQNFPPNAAIASAVNQVVGYWLFSCFNKERSVQEVKKATERKFHVSRSLTRSYATADCSGGYTQSEDCVFRRIVTARFGIVTGRFGHRDRHPGVL